LLYYFTDFVLDTSRRELRRAEDQIPIEPQVFDLLEFLIRARDRVVSRDELLDTVWRGRTVTDGTLSSRVNAARTAIGDTGEAQRLIRTLPRKGIRFVGEVREAPDLPSAAPVPEPTHPTEPEQPSIAVLPFTNMSGDPEQDSSLMAWRKTSSRRCPAAAGCSSSPATLPSSTSASRSTSARSGASLASPTCSKAASAVTATACASRDS
jgi:DNA-binding winged helix-turn-helix (wHTH) protein